MSYQTTILASTPLRYWPLNEASGTSATDLVASEVGTATGLTMGGAAAPTGIGGVAPVFTGGTEHITLRANKLLGGNAAWTVEAWVYYDPTAEPDATLRAFYGEQGTTGNDSIIGELSGGNSGAMNLTYGDDASAPTIGSQGVFLKGRWVLLHFTRSGSTVEMWWNGGRRTLSTAAPAGSTWTNTGVAAWLGNRPRGSHAWIGRIAQVAFYIRVLPQSEIIAHYQAGTPLTRATATKPTWNPISSIWNQDLIAASPAPTIDPNSAATVTKLVAQVTGHGAAASEGGGPVYTVTNATPKQRVRITGGSADNPSNDKPALYNALGVVPIPADLATGGGQDLEVSIYNSDTDELWDFWQMRHELLPPAWITLTWLAGGGTIPAGTHTYSVTALGPDTGHLGGFIYTTVVAPSSGGRVQVQWGQSEGAVGYQINRALGAAAGLFLLDVGDVRTWTDDGSIAGTTYVARPTAVTTDWGCSYAGYLASTDLDVGHWKAPRSNWGAAATSLPLAGGVVKLNEAMARNIPHAITMALAEIVSGAHVYPAQRNDGSGGTNAIQEGVRIQLNPAYDTTLIANLFERAVAVALQRYGGYIRDVAGAVTGCYVEDDVATGRDFAPMIYDGKWDFELFGNATFPWSQCRVIDPSWTLAAAQPAPDPPPKAATLTDNFGDGAISGNFTPDAGIVETGGVLRIPTSAAYPALNTTIGYDLVASQVSCHVVQEPTGDLADQTGFNILSIANTGARFGFAYEDRAGSGVLLRAQYYNSVGGIVDLVTVVPSAAHAWRRLREAGGTVYWEISSDGLAWSTFASLPWTTTGWSIGALGRVEVQWFAGNFNGVAGRPDFVIDDVNLAPAAGGGGGSAVLVVSRPDLWPDGTVVSAYSDLSPAGASPVGAVAEAATVATGSASFSALVPGRGYVLYALVGGQPRALRVRVQSVSAALLGRASGTGDLSAGSVTVSNVVTVTGAFQIGQRIAGAGIEPLTRIKAISGATLTLTNKAKASGTGVALEASDANTATGKVLRRRAGIGTS